MRAEISGQARISGPKPKFWPAILAWKKRAEIFWPEISGQNFKPKFQAKIPGQKMCLILFSCLPNANLGIKVLMLLWFLALNWIQKPGKSKLFMIFWHGIFWLEISAWNFGLKFWPGILAWKNQARNFGLKNRPEFQARNFGLKSYFGSQMKIS